MGDPQRLAGPSLLAVSALLLPACRPNDPPPADIRRPRCLCVCDETGSHVAVVDPSLCGIVVAR